MIVPCLDAEQTLPQCLDAVRANDYPPDRVELILVDNGSRDRSPALARERGATVLSRPGASIGALRNAGAAAARGDVLAFLDADCVPRPHWLREGVRALQQAPGVVGYPYDAPDDASWVERAWFAQRQPGRREVAGLSGGNMLVPRELFQRIGGFDEALRTGEDAEFCTRARRHGRAIQFSDSGDSKSQQRLPSRPAPTANPADAEPALSPRRVGFAWVAATWSRPV